MKQKKNHINLDKNTMNFKPISRLNFTQENKKGHDRLLISY